MLLIDNELICVVQGVQAIRSGFARRPPRELASANEFAMSTNTLPLLTALSLPAVTTFPSAECIQWTDDGQAIIVSASAAFILVDFR